MEFKLTYGDLKSRRVSRKDKGCKIRSCYWALHNPAEDCFEISWVWRWGENLGKKGLIAKVYPNGNVWFRPQFTVSRQYLHVGEANLLWMLTHSHMIREKNQYGKGIWYTKLGWTQRKNIPTRDRAVSADWVLFDGNGDVIDRAPPLKRTVDVGRRKELAQKVKALRQDTLLRARLGALTPKDVGHHVRWRGWNAESLEKMIADADKEDIRTFQPLVDMAYARYGTFYSYTLRQYEPVSVDTCLTKLFNAIHRKLLRDSDIVKYA